MSSQAHTRSVALSGNMALFFTADTHFGDHRTINIHRRPVASLSEMDKALVQAWNAVVSEEDEVWHFGDVARLASDVPALLAHLNGTKHLVRGKNDPVASAKAAGCRPRLFCPNKRQLYERTDPTL